MSENKELNMEEMEQAAGGWEYNGEYHGFFEWLNGYNIKCPYCGNESADIVHKLAASENEILFRCENCQKNFFLRYTWDKPNHKTIVVITK